MNIPLLDLKAQFQPLRAEIMAAVQTVCDEQGFILGPRVVAFEESVAKYVGARYAIDAAGLSAETRLAPDALRTVREGFWAGLASLDR